jgi:hypothetical protein
MRAFLQDHKAAILFCTGLLMLLYDATGHAAAALTEYRYRSGEYWVGPLWNTYSIYIWPRITDRLAYDIHWLCWHYTSATLMSIGFYLQGPNLKPTLRQLRATLRDTGGDDVDTRISHSRQRRF